MNGPAQVVQDTNQQYYSIAWEILLKVVGNAIDNHDVIPAFNSFPISDLGQIEIEVYPEWAPVGAQHFLELVVDGFYTNISFFRCVPRFLTQFGISDQPEQLHWHTIRFRDDVPKPRRPIMKHDVSFAGGGPDSRTTQVFIAFEDLPFLGEEPWETPFGRVVEGEETLSALYKGYGDIPPFGKGPDQTEIYREGNSYIHRLFPRTDFLLSCAVKDEAQISQIIHTKYQLIETDDDALIV